MQKLNVESFTNKDNFNFNEYFFAIARAFLVATSITEARLGRVWLGIYFSCS
jgi:hypothetical protein